MSKVIGVITARMSSTRLPGKVMKILAGKTIFSHVAERMSHVTGLDGVFLATSASEANRPLIEEAERLGYGWLAGAETDIVDRHLKLMEREGADAVIRVTCDCPLFDITSASGYVAEFKKEYRDFINVSNMPVIYGTLGELISYKALTKVHENYRGPAISLPIQENKDRFNTLAIEMDPELVRPEYRLTVDEPQDYELLSHIYEALYQGQPLALKGVYDWLDDNPEIAFINRDVGMKSVNIRAANIGENSVYSIVKSGEKYIILDEKKQMLPPDMFLDRLVAMFPELAPAAGR